MRSKNPYFSSHTSVWCTLKVSLKEIKHMTIIGLKELRQNISQIAERARSGESFMVVKRSKPVFEIRPVQPQGSKEEVEEWTKQYIKKNRKLLESLAEK